MIQSDIEELEDLFENAPCGYLSVGNDGRITRCNRTFSSWLGFPAEQVVGKRLRDLLNMAGRIFYETHFAPLLRMQGYFNEVALDLMTSSGKVLPVLANATERRDTDGNLVCTRVVFIHAEERRRYERGLVSDRALSQSSLDQERVDSELREQFIAVLGHDLRNPLSSIAAAARILGTEPQSERSTMVLALTLGSVARMSGLIDNVLDFARGRLGGGMTLDRNADEPLEPVLRHVIAELRASNPDRVVVVDLDLSDPVNCDRGRIGQLASNLLGNAFTHSASDQPIRVGGATHGGHFEFWVANGGQPLSDDAMERLFQPFSRGDVRAGQQGLGLGLHIASEIARAHGGELSVSSTEMETRFTFTMPLIPGADEEHLLSRP